MQYISDHDNGHDNNFNLLRVLAALAVLLSHSWPLTQGDNEREPLYVLVGLSLGHVAVEAFFVTSGFLVTSSLFRRAQLIDFVVARVLRIFPALLSVVFGCFVLGLVLTNVPWADFVGHPLTKEYLIRNSVIVTGARYFLPGVFERNPYVGSVNGSIWTLPWETWMYGLLAVTWGGAALSGPAKRKACGTAILIIAGIALFLFALSNAAPSILRPSPRIQNGLLPSFFLGSACYVLRRKIPLRSMWFWTAIGALTLAMLILSNPRSTISNFHTVFIVALPYIVLYLAFVPSGAIRRYNKLGDYSYGVYIWAFPVQQTLVASLPGISVGTLFALATPVTLLLAVISWRFIEQPALARKDRVIRFVRRKPLDVENDKS